MESGMSMFRVYFYNLNTRTEMKDYVNHGKTWLCTGAMVRDQRGEFIPGTTDHVELASFADMHCIKGRRTVTAADFDHPVAVKVWFGPGNVEWRKLVPTVTPVERSA
jgi:hypothetical protein